jgi:integrase
MVLRRYVTHANYSMLYRRQGIYRSRRQVPKELREIIGVREIKRSLRTTDLETAKRRLAAEVLRTDRLFTDARRLLSNPAALTTLAVQRDVEDRRKRPRTEDEHEAESLALTDAVERAETSRLDPVRAKLLRSVLVARQSDPDGLESGGTEDNPTLSTLFDRWHAERRAPAKTWEEWSTSRRRFEKVIGGDLPVRSITKAHVRAFKESLLRTPKRHGSGTMLSPASVSKGLTAVRSVLSWALSQGWLEVNPADGIRHAGARSAEQRSRRLGYDGSDLRAIFCEQNFNGRTGADRFLPLLGLWTGARVEELGGLRVEDVKDENGVPYLFIRMTDERRLKNEGSERRVPLHPALLAAGFLAYVAEMRKKGSAMLFPELKADAHGKLTRLWGKRFARHVRVVCGVADKRKAPMHSLRHAWATAARAVMPEEHRHALGGWSGGGVGRTYGAGVPLRVLAESMAKVRFEGIGD